jgi:hypothetical protein
MAANQASSERSREMIRDGDWVWGELKHLENVTKM